MWQTNDRYGEENHALVWNTAEKHVLNISVGQILAIFLDFNGLYM